MGGDGGEGRSWRATALAATWTLRSQGGRLASPSTARGAGDGVGRHIALGAAGGDVERTQANGLICGRVCRGGSGGLRGDDEGGREEGGDEPTRARRRTEGFHGGWGTPAAGDVGAGVIRRELAGDWQGRDYLNGAAVGEPVRPGAGRATDQGFRPRRGRATVRPSCQEPSIWVPWATACGPQ